jgi:putative AdoMet-dependent methyltransferase
MRYTSLFLTLFSSVCLLQASDEHRSDQWHEIWQKKGQKALQSHQSLHEADGYEVISQQNWQLIVKNLLLKARIDTAQSVCEFGCGAGALLDVAKTLNPALELYGFDYTSSLIELAKARFPEGHFWVQSITQPLPSEVSSRLFDLTICSGVFMYIDSEDDVTKALENMFSLTREGGKIVLGDISDLAKKELALQVRQQTHASAANQVAPGAVLDHLYLPKEFFTNFAEAHGLEIEFVEYSQIDPEGTYSNGQYRFCLIMTKSAK